MIHQGTFDRPMTIISAPSKEERVLVERETSPRPRKISAPDKEPCRTILHRDAIAIRGVFERASLIVRVLEAASRISVRFDPRELRAETRDASGTRAKLAMAAAGVDNQIVG